MRGTEWYIPSFFRFEKQDAPKEAVGLSLDYWGRGPIVVTTVYVGPAILSLAAQAAGCDSASNCTNSIYGMRPATILSNSTAVSGLLAGLFCPLVGAVIDHTSYRRAVGQYTAYALVALAVCQIFVNEYLWVFLVVCQTLSQTIYGFHQLITYAYNADLSQDAAKQVVYNEKYQIIHTISRLVYIVAVGVTSGLFGMSSEVTASYSQIITTIQVGSCFAVCWPYLFSEVPPSTPLPAGTSLMTAGFKKIQKTSQLIRKELPHVQWLMLAVFFNEAALVAVLSLLITVCVALLKMNSTEISILSTTLTATSYFGAKIGARIAERINPLRGNILGAFLYAVVTLVGCFMITGPTRKLYAYILAGLWGIGLTWVLANDLTLFITLTPPHSRAEFMGIYVFSSSMGSWIPPAFFSYLVQMGVPINLALASVTVFFVLGCLCYAAVGDFEHNVMKANAFGSVMAADGNTEHCGATDDAMLQKVVDGSLDETLDKSVETGAETTRKDETESALLSMSSSVSVASSSTSASAKYGSINIVNDQDNE